MDISTLRIECRIDQVFTFITKTVTVLVENIVNIMFSASDLCHYDEIMLYSLRNEKIFWLLLYKEIQETMRLEDKSSIVTTSTTSIEE